MYEIEIFDHNDILPQWKRWNHKRIKYSSNVSFRVVFGENKTVVYPYAQSIRDAAKYIQWSKSALNTSNYWMKYRSERNDYVFNGNFHQQ